MMLLWGTKTNHAMDNEIAYEKRCVSRVARLFQKRAWTAQLIFSLRPTSAPSLESNYVIIEARLSGPPTLSGATYKPTLSEDNVSRLQEVELRVAASINRYLDGDGYDGHEDGPDWRIREKVNAEKRDIVRHLAPKYS
jgi:hypothetical protein